ncbi:MAG: hypothetical protein AAFY49_01285 [Pseudomonadota bacterium]
MVILLQVLGWLGIVSGLFNAFIKLFADDDALLRYAGPSRDLNLNLTVLVFSLILLALAQILAELRKLSRKQENS